MTTDNSGATGNGQGNGVSPMVEMVLRNGRVLPLPEGVAPARTGALADALEGLAR
jgi:hypothetical protein